MPGRSRRRWRGRAQMEPVAHAQASAKGRKRSVVRAPACPRSPTHERLVALYPPPDRDFAARDRRHARRDARLYVAAGLLVAAGRFPHHSGHDPASGRQPRSPRLRNTRRSDGMSGGSFSEPFIRRPVGTTLLALGLFLVGAVAYRFLPVASMPTVDFPTINVTASRPGADPETMAATVAAPLERRL